MSGPIILVVEDRQADQLVLQHLLDKFNYDVQVVDSAESALGALSFVAYSAILMNLTLPGMSGISCARRIRQIEALNKHHIPIIAITAKADSATRHHCLAAGMDGYLSKPFSPHQLHDMLDHFVS